MANEQDTATRQRTWAVWYSNDKMHVRIGLPIELQHQGIRPVMLYGTQAFAFEFAWRAYEVIQRYGLGMLKSEQFPGALVRIHREATEWSSKTM